MSNDLKERIQDAFSECYALDEVARLYFDIRLECEKQLEYMSIEIAKEMQANGVLKWVRKKYIDVDLLKSELKDLNESERLYYMGKNRSDNNG